MHAPPDCKRARRLGALVLLAPVLAVAALPQVGPVDADFAGVDQAAIAYLEGKGQPGVSVVVAYGDRIVYAQGYGYADRASGLPTSPWLEYRLASVSKTFTATAVMRLVEQGRVSLDAPAWNYVAAYMAAEPLDARVKTVTVRQLLTHSWGLDRATTTDPNGGWYVDSGGQTVSTSRALLRNHLLTKRLDFAPGARYAYNGAGYSWLQLIAETVDGRPLDRQLTALLGPEPLSTGRVRIGTTLPSAITPAEPTYYDRPDAGVATPVPGLYPAPAPAKVAWPYGGYTLQAYGGGGGLIASALTVTRFVQRLQGSRQPALLMPATFAQMRTEQALADGTRYAGLGVQVVPIYNNADYSILFSGSIAGARTGWLNTSRAPGGTRLTVVVLVNGSWSTSDDIHAELISPIVFAVDRIGYAKVAAKPEIGGDALIARNTVTENHFADLLFDWGERLFPSLFPSHPPSGHLEGFRYRYYAATNTYLGARDGRIWLFQPSLGPAVQNVAGMVDFLPQATRDTDAQAGSAPPRGSR